MTAINDPNVQKVLMENPEVQAAIKRAGQDALQNPEVQQKIFETCKKEFPGLAGQAKDQCMVWAKDPEVQRQVQQYAGMAGAMAADYAGKAGAEFMNQIEQGPAGVRFLAFCGGAASVGYAGYTLLGLLNPLNLIGGVVTYVICGYQLAFGLTSTIFEMPPEYMQKVPGVDGYQNMLMVKAAFLSDVAGRGLFYIFVGSLWLALGGLSPVDLALGCYMTFIGALHIAMHYGKLGVVTEKLKDGAAAAKSKAEELRPLTGTQ
jgi:hypothetical protein